MSPSSRPRRPAPALLDDLRARIRRLERHGVHATDDPPAPLPFGAAAIDAALPWGGLPRACLHEVGGTVGAATGFCAALLARLAEAGGTVLWCRRGRGLHGPGLAAFGLAAERLIVVRGRNDREMLWAMEEGLRSTGLAAVLGEVGTVTATAARRLQLAAEAGGVTALLLRPRTPAAASPALTRWRVSPAPSPRLDVRWRLELLHVRSAAPRSWFVEWQDGTTGGFSVAAEAGHRPAEPAPARRLAG